MGNWDRELIELLPKAVKVYASAGAGFDWVDTEILAEHGESKTVGFAGKEGFGFHGVAVRSADWRKYMGTWNFGKRRG